jgi:hypothetical protein
VSATTTVNRQIRCATTHFRCASISGHSGLSRLYINEQVALHSPPQSYTSGNRSNFITTNILLNFRQRDDVESHNSDVGDFQRPSVAAVAA